MSVERARPAKVKATVFATEGHVAGVDALMDFEVVFAGEGSVACCASDFGF